MKNLKPGKLNFNPEQASDDEENSRKIKKLQEPTLYATRGLDCDKAIFYSDYLEQEDDWKLAKFQQHLQFGLELGERIENAFALAFKKGYEKVILIGSEYYELTPDLINDAFSSLDTNDIVIGPSGEGGYYLLGMKKIHPRLFRNKTWGKGDVLLDTILDMNELKISYVLLETLNDVREVQDVESFHKTY